MVIHRAAKVQTMSEKKGVLFPTIILSYHHPFLLYLQKHSVKCGNCMTRSAEGGEVALLAL